MSRVGLSNFAAALRPQQIHWFESTIERYPFVYDGIVNVRKQDEAVHRDQLIVGMGNMLPRTDGQSTPYDYIRQGFKKDYEPTGYRLGAIITSDLIDDGRGISFAERVTKGLATGWTETKNTEVTNVFSRAFNSSYTGGDGVELCGTHTQESGTYSNKISVAQDISEAALEQCILELKDIRDERGLRELLKPVSLMVSASDEFNVERILASKLRPDYADNTVNALNSLGKFPGGVKVIDHLTDPDAFFIFTQASEQGVALMIRKELEVSTDVDFDTDSVKIKGHGRLVAGWTNPKHVFGCPGA